jgi:hypothetical protein
MDGRNYVSYWPGIELPTTGPNCAHGESLVGESYYCFMKGRVLTGIGSPIGIIVAFLLFQHKVELSIKQITSVTNFRDTRDDPQPQVKLLYKVEDYGAPQEQREEERRGVYIQ